MATGSTAIDQPQLQQLNRRDSGINSVELWDWPFNESGYVKCHRDDKKFVVALDFKSLKAVDLKTVSIENGKSQDFNWSVGLAPVGATNQSFSRLEIQVFRHLHLVIIDAGRQVIKSAHQRKSLKTVRRVFKLPREVDMATVRAQVVNGGLVVLQADMSEPN